MAPPSTSVTPSPRWQFIRDRMRTGWYALVAAITLLFGLRFGFAMAATVLVCLGTATAGVMYIRRVGGPWRTRRARLSFTRDGKYLVGITIGVGLAAINTGNNLLYLFLGMLLAMIVVSGVLSEVVLQKLRVRRRLPGHVFVGDTVLVGMRIENAKRRIPSYSLLVRDKVGTQSTTQQCYFLKIKATSAQSTSYQLTPNRRGRLQFETVILSTRFPFGFFVKSRLREKVDSLIVFPRLRRVTLPEPLQMLDLDGDQTNQTSTGREFSHLRDYREGDDARDIHWKRSAARTELVTRSYTGDGQRSSHVVINTSVPLSMDLTDESFIEQGERCLELAASYVVHRLETHECVTADVNGIVYQLSGDQGGLHAFLTQLALASFTHHAPSNPDQSGNVPVSSVMIVHPCARPMLNPPDGVHVLDEAVLQ